MREFLLANARTLLWTDIVLEAAVAAALLFVYRKNRRMEAVLAFAVALGLIYDALIIVLGSTLAPGALAALSQLRFVFHGLLVPLLLPIGAYAMDMKEKPLKLVWIVTALIMAAGVYMGFAQRLEPAYIAGVTRLVSTDATPTAAKIIERIVTFGTVFPLMIAGVFTIRRKNGPFILLGGLLMFLFSALGPATGNIDLIFLISSFGELFMLLCFCLHARRRGRAA